MLPEEKVTRRRSLSPSSGWFAPAERTASVAWREGRHCLLNQNLGLPSEVEAVQVRENSVDEHGDGDTAKFLYILHETGDWVGLVVDEITRRYE